MKLLFFLINKVIKKGMAIEKFHHLAAKGVHNRPWVFDPKQPGSGLRKKHKPLLIPVKGLLRPLLSRDVPAVQICIAVLDDGGQGEGKDFRPAFRLLNEILFGLETARREGAPLVRGFLADLPAPLVQQGRARRVAVENLPVSGNGQ